ncbi:MAG: hypothetical protein IJB10_03130 [Clostridia bacterium]|nr:hypothetical protein [Clostridia bacterium]
MKVKAKIESLDFKEGEITLPKELENIFDEKEPKVFDIELNNIICVALYNDISKEIVVFDSLLASKKN